MGIWQMNTVRHAHTQSAEVAIARRSYGDVGGGTVPSLMCSESRHDDHVERATHTRQHTLKHTIREVPYRNQERYLRSTLKCPAAPNRGAGHLRHLAMTG